MAKKKAAAVPTIEDGIKAIVAACDDAMKRLAGIRTLSRAIEAKGFREISIPDGVKLMNHLAIYRLSEWPSQIWEFLRKRGVTDVQ